MAEIKAGTLVAGLAGAALIAIGALAAVSGPPPRAAVGTAGATGRTGTSGAGGTADKARPAPDAPAPDALPAHSGLGERVVYSLGRRRVWLVDPNELVLRTYRVMGGAVRPAIGGHRVFARRAEGVGGDGERVEHAVFFARSADRNVGFSAALDAPLRPPDPTKRTAAVREGRADALALWEHAMIGTAVEVTR
ncbi:hypothetical protein [Streptomyces sp. NBC_01190]|uniref:hypothetical protein n=1 Tax=Streptomyces sp. NBC_01190 TaxID=2903767 RepID=UPI0038662F27|nr:hypothetical protein OG519_21440 [Streptomyces sp. NBC_01190]